MKNVLSWWSHLEHIIFDRIQKHSNRHIRDTNYDHPLPQIKKQFLSKTIKRFQCFLELSFPFKNNQLHTTVRGTLKHLTILVKRGRNKVYILHFLSIWKKKKFKFGKDITSFLKSLHTKTKIHFKLSYLTKTIISNSSPQFPKGVMSIGIS